MFTFDDYEQTVVTDIFKFKHTSLIPAKMVYEFSFTTNVLRWNPVAVRRYLGDLTPPSEYRFKALLQRPYSGEGGMRG